MTDFYEYYVDEKLNRQRAIARAKRYSAKCYRKRNRRNYAVAVAVGLLLAFFFFAWQITRPVQSAPTASQYGEVSEPAVHDPVVSAILEPLGEFTLTAYCPCELCCGQWAINRPLDANGDPIIYTASGEIATPNLTVAVDPDVIPLGTQLCIDGLGVYTAQDTGAFTGNIVDIYFEDHAAACEFGKQTAKIWEVTHS